MSISITVEDKADENWNETLLHSKLGNIYQTKHYAEYAKKRSGWQPLFMKFFTRNGELAGQLLLFRYSRFDRKLKLLSRRFSDLVSKPIKTVSANYKWVYGPVILNMDYREAIYQNLGDFLLRTGRGVSGNIHPLDGQVSALDKMGFVKELWGTFIIDLTQSKETLWKLLDKKSARKNIERAKKRNVIVREMCDGDIPVYFELLKETRDTLGLANYKYEDIIDGWTILKDAGFTGFMAFGEEKPLAGLLLSTYNKYVNEWGVARSKYDADNRLYAQDLIKWHVIETGHGKKYEYYDLTGVNPSAKDEKERGIYQYKEKWGGKFVNYPIYKWPPKSASSID